MQMNRRTTLRSLCAAGVCAVLARPSRGLTAKIKPDAACALIIIDVQHCFLSGGTLAVAHGDEVVPVIAAWRNMQSNGVKRIHSTDIALRVGHDAPIPGA